MKRILSGGRVALADCVAKRRAIADGRVVPADGVAKERLSTGGRVVISVCVDWRDHIHCELVYHPLHSKNAVRTSSARR